jgi:hypothetical protein
MLSHFDWVVHGFDSGHCVHTIQDHGLPFCSVLPANLFNNGQALIWELTSCLNILSGDPALLDYVCGSGLTSKTDRIFCSFPLLSR